MARVNIEERRQSRLAEWPARRAKEAAIIVNGKGLALKVDDDETEVLLNTKKPQGVEEEEGGGKYEIRLR